MSSSRGSSRPRNQTHVSYVSCIGRWVPDHKVPDLGKPQILAQLRVMHLFHNYEREKV